MSHTLRGSHFPVGSRSLAIALLCGIAAAGCTRQQPQSPPAESRPAPVLAPAAQVLAEVTQTPQQIKAEMKLCAPDSPAFEEARLKLLVAWEKIRRQEGVEGFQAPAAQPTSNSMAYLDPASGQIAWRALACFNPDCQGTGKAGGPMLFVRPYKNISIGSDGKLAFHGIDEETDPSRCVCPACGSPDFVRAYDLPEAVVQERELNEEMSAIYAAYHQAEQSGQPVSLPGRAPAEVMTSKAQLPKLFLLPEPGKVVEAGRYIVPAFRGKK